MDAGVAFGEDKMKTHKCKQCGLCCTKLKPSEPGVPGGLLLTPEETAMFINDAGKDIIPTVCYTTSGDDVPHIIYYGMIAKRCPMYDWSGCSIYENRPLVCRRYPLGKNDICEANPDCPIVQDGGVLFDDETFDAMFDLDIRSREIMATVPKGSILYIYNIENEKWDIIGVR